MGSGSRHQRSGSPSIPRIQGARARGSHLVHLSRTCGRELSFVGARRLIGTGVISHRLATGESAICVERTDGTLGERSFPWRRMNLALPHHAGLPLPLVHIMRTGECYAHQGMNQARLPPRRTKNGFAVRGRRARLEPRAAWPRFVGQRRQGIQRTLAQE